MPFSSELESYKEETRAAYDKLALKKKEQYEKDLDTFVRFNIQFFLRELHGKCIVDLGSGPGVHAGYFRDKGYDVVCVDYSEGMLTYCKEKGFKTHLIDMEKFSMPDSTVDGVWAYASILHLRKVRIPIILEKIHRMLKPNGVVGLGLFGGQGEGWKVDSPDVKRWFSLFTDEEVRRAVSPFFDVIHFKESSFPGHEKFLFYVLRKR
ncbi:MAG: class I SAM-dependent methyltransferase [Candidatus Diapherotrites archaeon]